MINNEKFIRNDWQFEELETLYDLPLIELISKAHQLHVQFHTVSEVQLCQLISVKTGGCPEDCKYCAQSSSSQTAVFPQAMMKYEEVIGRAEQAIKQGVTRICLGAAWREVKDGKQFDEILKMVRAIADLGVEVCCTLGMLKEDQAKRLKKAGLYAYNHNLDTSKEFYPSIITTRTYEDRLQTLDIVEKANITLCCGGILGMGEQPKDRLKMLLTLSNRSRHPESMPINLLTAVPGTPLALQKPVSIWEFIRMVALARFVLPKTMIRLSCGRIELSCEQQALCFLAGGNSIFVGDKLLTLPNSDMQEDAKMFALLGLKKRQPYAS